MSFIVHADGGSRGNPGIAGFGVVITDNTGKTVYEHGGFIGLATNNTAEYSALLNALSWLLHNASTAESIQITMDSQLVIRQMQGKYRVKSPHILDLYKQAKLLEAQLSVKPVYTDVRREYNVRADELANLAMDAQSDINP